MEVELEVAPDTESAARRAAELLAGADGDVALAGGSTPARAYALAADMRSDWSGTRFWWGDERCVPPDDERSNYRLVRETLLDRIGARDEDVHRIRGELPPEEAASAYDRDLEGVRLELALLGIGPDGHTASLFPYAPTLREGERRAVAAEPGLEPFVDRVTMTVPMLGAAALVVFLVAGGSKAEAARRAFAEPSDSGTPASLVRGVRTLALLDRAAAALL